MLQAVFGKGTVFEDELKYQLKMTPSTSTSYVKVDLNHLGETMSK